MSNQYDNGYNQNYGGGGGQHDRGGYMSAQKPAGYNDDRGFADQQSVNISQAQSQQPPQSDVSGTYAREELKVEMKSLDKFGSTKLALDCKNEKLKGFFPAWDRFKNICCGCCRPKESGIEQITKVDPLFKDFDDVFGDELKSAEYALKLAIKGTGILEMDQYVLHPFVRVHIIDIRDRRYLQKKDPAQPGTSNNESVNCFEYDITQKKKIPKQITADYFLPFSTRMYDLRIHGSNFCEWDEEFIINEHANKIIAKDIVIMFELLDFPHDPSLLIGPQRSNLLRNDNLYPIAWAYLRPLGSARCHMERIKLQFYKFKFKPDDSLKFNRPIDPRTPDVLLELDWAHREKFNSFLEIELSFCNKPQLSNITKTIDRKHISRAPWEREIGQYVYSFDTDERLKQMNNNKKVEKLEDIADVLRLRRWEKFWELPSVLPDTLLHKFETEAQGSFKIKFSDSGQYIAIACTMENVKQLNKKLQARTVIKIHDVEKENGKHCATLSGHGDIIHDLSWGAEDRFLVSASADGSVKVWNMQKLDDPSPEKFNHLDNDDKFFVTEILHPSFVYAAKVHPYSDANTLHIATACYDKMVRVWQVNVDGVDDGNKIGEVYATLDPANEVSILAKPEHTIGPKGQVYQNEDDLEDETLRLLINPQEQNPLKHKITSKKTDKKKRNRELADQREDEQKAKYREMLDSKHPNCMVFDNSGKLYVGDSSGEIYTWRVVTNFNQATMHDHMKLQHKEIEGDQINNIIVNPINGAKNQIFVQSRDNCIRLLDFENQRGTRIRNRFFGSKCQNSMVKSCLSPDGQFLVSGSETGQPFVWDAGLEKLEDSRRFQIQFGDSVSDCDWNPKYNMFAIAGFGQEFPVLIYVFRRTEKDINELMLRYNLTSQNDTRIDLDNPMNQQLHQAILKVGNELNDEVESRSHRRVRSQGPGPRPQPNRQDDFNQSNNSWNERTNYNQNPYQFNHI